MGIKFRCPQCSKKIHVKSYLAGKRGLCPQCQARFTIPAAGADGSELVDDDHGADGQGPPQIPAQVQAVSAQAGYAPQAMPRAAAAQGFAPAGVNPAYAAPAPLSAVPAVLPDPFADDPQAAWHMRLASGDQYGPATSEEMRQWLEENRITPDSLVWREGWADWKRADATFPRFSAPRAAAPAMAAMPMGANPAAAYATAAYAPVATAMPVATAAMAVRAQPAAESPGETSSDTMQFIQSVSSGKSQSSGSSGGGEPNIPRRPSNTPTVVAVVIGVLALAVLVPTFYFVLQGPPGKIAPGGVVWTLFRGPNGRFEVKMPVVPEQVNDSELSPAGMIRSSRFLADTRNKLGYAFSISAAELVDPAAVTRNPDAFFESSAEHAAKVIRGADLTKGTPSSLAGHSGRQYMIRTGRGQQAMARIFVIGKHRYVLLVIDEWGKGFENRMVKEFYESFKVHQTSEPLEPVRQKKDTEPTT